MKTAGKVTRNGRRRKPGRKPEDEPLEKRLLRMVDKITADIPPEAWDSLPRDLSKNLDHYLYGSPKQDEK